MNLKHNGFNSSLHLCDIIQKYNLKSPYNLPKIRVIVVTLTLNDILNSMEKTLTRDELQKYSVYLIFILQLRFPKISFVRNKLNEDFKLKIFLRNNKEITFFNNMFFTEILKSLTLSNKKIKFEKVKKVFHVTSTNFPEIKKVFASTFLKLNVQPFDIRVEFRLSEGCLKGTNAFYCIPYFWLFK